MIEGTSLGLCRLKRETARTSDSQARVAPRYKRSPSVQPSSAVVQVPFSFKDPFAPVAPPADPTRIIQQKHTGSFFVETRFYFKRYELDPLGSGDWMCLLFLLLGGFYSTATRSGMKSNELLWAEIFLHRK